MKQFLIGATISIFMLCLAAPIGLAQTAKPTAGEEETVDNATLPGIKSDAKLKQSRWDLEQLVDNALDQLPDFLNEIPNTIKRISVVRLDGDEYIYVNTVSLKNKLHNELISSGKFEVVECRQCNNMKVYVEDESLILSRAIESNDQLAKLGKELKLDAYIQGVVTVNETLGKIQIGLQFINIKTGVVLKSASLDSFYLADDEADEGKALQASNLEKSTLDLEVLFPRLLTKVPEVLSDLPGDISSVTLGELRGDDTYYVDKQRLQVLFENALVNKAGLNVIECPMCTDQQATSSSQMKKLGHRQGFDAYIKSNLKIHEEDQKIEFNFKIINAKDNSIAKAISLKTLDEDSTLESDSEHSFTIIPFVTMMLQGDVYSDGEWVTGTASGFTGLQYRFVTTSIFENLLIGFDFEMFSPTSKDYDELAASVALVNIILKYRLPFKLNNYRVANLAFGYGAVSSVMASTGDDSVTGGLSNNAPMKLEGDILITPSLGVGLAYYMLGTLNFTYNEDEFGFDPEQTFTGSAFGLYFRYTF